MKLLIPVDGSERSHRAVQHVIDCFDRSRTTHVRLINVQPAIPFVRKWRLKAEDIRREQMRQGGKALRHAIERGNVGSMILWGPPGTGKTTLARVIANVTHRVFVPLREVRRAERVRHRVPRVAHQI